MNSEWIVYGVLIWGWGDGPDENEEGDREKEKLEKEERETRKGVGQGLAQGCKTPWNYQQSLSCPGGWESGWWNGLCPLSLYVSPRAKPTSGYLSCLLVYEIQHCYLAPPGSFCYPRTNIYIYTLVLYPCLVDVTVFVGVSTSGALKSGREASKISQCPALKSSATTSQTVTALDLLLFWL